MKPINKKAREELLATLNKHKGELNREIDRCGWEIKQLVEKQQIRKRKRKEIDQMIHCLRNEGATQ